MTLEHLNHWLWLKAVMVKEKMFLKLVDMVTDYGCP